MKNNYLFLANIALGLFILLLLQTAYAADQDRAPLWSNNGGSAVSNGSPLWSNNPSSVSSSGKPLWNTDSDPALSDKDPTSIKAK